MQLVRVLDSLPMTSLPRKPGAQWGAYFKRLQGAVGITSEELAAELGVARGTVYAWRRGVRWPEPYHFPALRDLLRVASTDELFDPESRSRLDRVETDLDEIRRLLAALVQEPPQRRVQDE